MSKKDFWWLFEEEENEERRKTAPKKQRDRIETKEDLERLKDFLENFVRSTFGIKIKINGYPEVHSTYKSRIFVFKVSLEDKILSFWAKSKSGVKFGVDIEIGGIVLREEEGLGKIVFQLWITESDGAKVLADEEYFVKMLH